MSYEKNLRAEIRRAQIVVLDVLVMAETWKDVCRCVDALSNVNRQVREMIGTLKRNGDYDTGGKANAKST